ncbi:hypothetical protein ACFFMP_10335 [Pseudoroseomonas cervicalis]|uniref:hypothetical protein n=1 Tax=Teichococcus cervicalis TaxID=204525 RepID=UPI0035EA6067
MRPSACLLAVCALAPLALPAQAQLRSLTVPAESGVVVPPRGQAPPRRWHPAARAVAPQAATAAVPEPPARCSCRRAAPAAGPLGAVLPLAAAALLAAAAGGGSSGGGAAARRHRRPRPAPAAEPSPPRRPGR